MKKTVYIVLCVLGTLVPSLIFVPYAMEHNIGVVQFAKDIFASPLASSLSADLLFSSFALWALIYFELRKRDIKFWWLPIVLNMTIGLSTALPLFLLLRELSKQPEKRKRHSY